MVILYLTLAAVGLVLLIAQLALGVAGGDLVDLPDAGDAPGDTSLAEGFELLTARSLSAAASATGLAGLSLHAVEVPALVALPVALLAGFGAAVVVARAPRAMLRLERDHVPRVANAIGLVATVHVTIPAAGSGLGKVTLELQGHFMELAARTGSPDPIPPGTAVLVTGVTEDDVLDVTPASALLPEMPA